MMPASTCLSGTLGRPPLGVGRSGGRSGSTARQSSSGTVRYFGSMPQYRRILHAGFRTDSKLRASQIKCERSELPKIARQLQRSLARNGYGAFRGPVHVYSVSSAARGGT